MQQTIFCFSFIFAHEAEYSRLELGADLEAF